LPVPGTGTYRWDGFRDDLPYEYNPERGWIATANHNVHPPGYAPPLFFKRAPYVRWDRLNQILSSARDLRAEDFERFQHDSYWPYIDAEKALLRGWTSPDRDVEWARQQILAWDGRYERDSVVPSLHNYWRRRLEPEVLQTAGGAAKGGVPGRAEKAQLALERGVSELREQLGADRTTWRWGRLHKSEFPHWLVQAFALPGVERSGGGGTVAATGATYREIIDFSDLDNSRTINTPGQSGQPGSPFYDNLRQLWGNGKFFPLRYSRKAVEEAAAYRLTLRPRT
jgi:penicillin amidase